MKNIYKAFSVYKTIKKTLFMATIGNCKAMHISLKIRCIQWDNCEKAFAYNTQYTPLNIKIHLSDSGNFKDKV